MAAMTKHGIEKKRAADRARYQRLKSDPEYAKRNRERAAAHYKARMATEEGREAERLRSVERRNKERLDPVAMDKAREYQREYHAKNYRGDTKRGEEARKRANRWKAELRATAEGREVLRLQGKADRLKRGFGISMSDYDEMLSAQGSRCAICRMTETAPRSKRDPRPRDLAVDHDHATGAIRGLLCVRCNATLGQAMDDPERLIAAAAYLRRNGR